MTGRRMSRLSVAWAAVVLVAPALTEVRADTRLAYVLGAFAAEEVATPKKSVVSFRKGDAELAYEIETVFPDRLHMIVTSPTARQELMELGLLSLPVILIGDKRLTGFNPKAIDAALAEG